MTSEFETKICGVMLFGPDRCNKNDQAGESGDDSPSTWLTSVRSGLAPRCFDLLQLHEILGRRGKDQHAETKCHQFKKGGSPGLRTAATVCLRGKIRGA